MKKISSTELSNALGERIDFFVCSASFENRCLTVANALANRIQCTNSLIFYSSISDISISNRNQLKSLLGQSKTREEKISVSSPIDTTVSIARALYELVGTTGGHLLLDATTFTHEQLLIVIRFISHLQGILNTKIKLTITYSGAQQYGYNPKSTEELWLSRGVREIRPVIGFSGRFKTGQMTQLILLVGFENERARAVIEYVEPGALALGIGRKNDSISSELANTNQFFYEKLSTFIKNVSQAFSDVVKFDMSVVDSEITRKELLAVVKPETHNVIICPMNTKISTIGAALVALQDPRIQIMYVEPLEYNELGYSISGTDIRYGEINLFAN